MNIDELFQDPEYGNFVCVYLGLAFIGKILKKYTKDGLKQVHQKIQTALEGNPPCPGTCGNNSRCETCKKWQEKLNTFSRQPKIDWTKSESRKWPLSYKYIADIFTSSPGGLVNFRDVSTTCSIWESCTEFNIEPSVLKNVNKCRKVYFERNATLKVTDNNKAETIDALTNLLNEGDIQDHINEQDRINHVNRLEEIKNGKNLPKEIARISEEIKRISNDDDKIAKIATKLTESGTEDRELPQRIQKLVIKHRESQQREHLFLRARLHDISNILRHMRSYLKYLCVAIGILVAITLVYFSLSYLQRDEIRQLNITPSRNYRNSIDSKYSGCLSESYKYPFPLDVPLLEYLPTENKLIGREWVYDELEQKIFKENTKSRGTLMIAEYGFGKSAIVADLLCARENEKGWKLRQHTVAFHVCKFQNSFTKNPVQLIKRLIWFLSIKSADYRQYIEMLENSIINDNKKCEENIHTCFELAITNPLDKLTVPIDNPWIIVLDALDECMENDGRNRILELLSDRLIFMQQNGRKWFKWIITSRNMSTLAKLRKLDTVNCPFEDERNYGDIRQFIIKRLNMSHVRLLDTFVYKSGGIFLYIKHALEYMVESGNVSIQNIVNLPSGIEEIYELNFDRLFGNNNDFGVAKHILQLISVKMFHTADLLRIIEAKKTANESEFGRVMDKLSFLVSSDDYVVLRHISLYEWLISDTNLKYRLSLRVGHVMVSEYLFNITDIDDLQPISYRNGNLYISEVFEKLAYHVSESDETYLQRKFFCIKLLPGNYNLKVFVAIYSRFIRSNKMLKLIVNFVMDDAAQYKFIRFIRYLYKYILEDWYSKLDAVSLIRDYAGSMYEIDKYPLHTAAKYCKEDVARYLINVVNISLWERDNFRQLSIEYAVSHGCVNVLELIAEKDPSVLDTAFVSAVFRNPEVLYDISKLFAANRRKPSCVTLQNEMMMQISVRRFMPHLILSTFFQIFSKNIFHMFGFSLNEKINEFKIIADLYPELLSCSNIFGYTPVLQVISLNFYKGFSALLEIGMKDKCHPVSSGMLYVFYAFTVHFNKMILKYDFFHPLFMSTDVACPEEASVEHFLMRYKRIDMINLVIANGYIMNWTKTDRKGKTPQDYTDQIFILQLECHFGVDIDVLSDKDSLVKLCLCDWFYFYLLLVLCTLVVSIALLCILCKVCKVAFL